MSDVLTKTQRSRCMKAIRSKDTEPELLLRKTLWYAGYRYRIKNRLPGRPDIVFPAQRVAVFVDGCFWHGCPAHYQKPGTNARFWSEKIRRNIERDKEVNVLLRLEGWKVMRLWEHDVRNSPELCALQVIKELESKRCILT